MPDSLLVTNSPKVTVKSTNSGSTQNNNPFLNRQSQGNQLTGPMPHYGGGAEKCARCSKSVYLAEKKAGAGRSFHSRCFSCNTCNRKLDATTLSEHKGEIYCKTCYTRQFGMHGLVSGVTMSTEQPAREVRHSRRSSYGSDLDAPVITHQQVRQRAHSNDNMLRGETSAVNHDELPKMFPWRNDVLPEKLPPREIEQTNNGLDHLVDKYNQRPISQIGFERVVELTGEHNYARHSSQNGVDGDDDRHRSVFDSDKTPYTNGTSAIVDMPIIPSPQRPNSHIERMEMPAMLSPQRLNSQTERIEMPAMPSPQRSTSQIERVEMCVVPSPQRLNSQIEHEQRSRSPSPTSADVYRRKSSRERPADISDNFARMTLNENQQEVNHHDYLNVNQTTNTIAKENPLVKQTNSYIKSNDNQKIIRSRDSSPSETNNSNRSPSPTSGYASSSVIGEGRLRDSTSPPSAFVPQHDYLNIQPAHSQVVDRRSSSPRQTDRTSSTSSSAVNDFVSRTSHISPPPATGKYSTISALIKPLRPTSSQQSSPNDDDLM